MNFDFSGKCTIAGPAKAKADLRTSNSIVVIP